ncbi:hypothetical protein SAMN04488244_11020 [Vibrio hangzhouensis]|uniref:Uncharacterized protein n=1 Tax=Vibrio hangzhouensis TaxID=462991 RepID=A0A1H5YTM3_9VIBR|nr:hypothetical protein SAMN04488244_11020 [Vibrio hangzhouensis]
MWTTQIRERNSMASEITERIRFNMVLAKCIELTENMPTDCYKNLSNKIGKR